MDTVVKHFERMGAKAKVREARGWRQLTPIRLDVKNDTWGRPYFDLSVRPGTTARALTVEPKGRHLLLQVEGKDDFGETVKSKFLCGHDERNWFVAAIPEGARGVKDVPSAMEALKPPEVRERQAAVSLPRKHRRTRKNKAFLRQGEWFFVPVDLKVEDPFIIQKDGVIRRGRGKPHIVAEEYRRDGTLVFVHPTRAPNGITKTEFEKLPSEQKYDDRGIRLHAWSTMYRDPVVYARGTVKHPDHATITLNGWHRVYQNTETKAKAMKHVAFLD